MKLFKKVMTFALVLVMALQVVAFATPDQAMAASKTLTFKKDTTVYASSSTKSSKVGTIPADHTVTVVKSTSKYYKVSVNINGEEVTGYVKKSTTKTKATGSDVIAYAKQFVGNPYRYGGTSLTRGTDCSGFVLAVYKHFGYNLPHSSSAMRSVGKRVRSLSVAKAGDILCYRGHVAIYMGNGRLIHAANPRKGICISKYIRRGAIVAIRRLV